MDRDYSTDAGNDVTFFVGREVENTPAKGSKTLFVVGLQPIKEIKKYLGECDYDLKHIFFGANHSFNPLTSEEWDKWESMIKHFLKEGLLCSLDIPLALVEQFNEGPLCEYNNFIPQIRVPIPYVRLWNYNTTIKIDDKDFNATNPGVWSHSLHTLMDRKYFTDWSEYKNDKVLK